MGTYRANRGDWRRLVSKEYQRIPGDPIHDAWWGKLGGRSATGNHNRCRCWKRESDRPIVAKKWGNAHEALTAIQRNIEEKRRVIYDADLSSYFDTIDHDLLMEQLKRRITDRSVLKLIRMWLKSPIEGIVNDGKQIKRPDKGTPQGGVISPLLANLFLHYMDYRFMISPGSPFKFANARIIRYADDFVFMAGYMGKRIIDWLKEILENQLHLVINQEKTGIVKLNQRERLDFLGFSFRFADDRFGRDKSYLNIFPSLKAQKKLREKVKQLTQSVHKKSMSDMIEELNEITAGWKNYFNYGYPGKAFRDANY